ncbi:Uncharacterised protein [Vibrio cholerae]|nr:Uncharacterised protein [Vibrio cholerae]CSC68449.1 Uncharacterised protein [Vibrio cholerae]
MPSSVNVSFTSCEVVSSKLATSSLLDVLTPTTITAKAKTGISITCPTVKMYSEKRPWL